MQSYRVLPWVLLWWTMSFLSMASGQSDSLWIAAKIVNEETQQPLVDASILIEGTDQGTVTDENGSFRLWVSADAYFRISFTGFQAKRLSARNIGQLELISLAPGLLEEEILITARPIIQPGSPWKASIRLEPKNVLLSDPYNVQSVFANVPGVQSQAGALNTTRLIFRGLGTRTPFSTDQVRLYLDDIPLINGSGESTIEEIEGSAIALIQAYQSPGLSMYGNELGGTVLINSFQQSSGNQTLIQPTFNVSVGSFGRNQQNAGLLIGRQEDRHKTRLLFARTASDGYRDNNSYERLSGFWSGQWQLDSLNASTLSYLFHWRSLEAGIPSSLNEVDFRETPSAAPGNWAAVSGNEDHQNFLGGISLRTLSLNTGSASRWQLGQRSTIFASRHTNTEVRPFNVLDETNQLLGARSTWSLYSYQNTSAIAGHEFQAGGEVYQERYDQNILETLDEGAIGPLLSEVREFRLEYFGFLSYQYRSPDEHLILQTGLNWRQKSFRWEGPTLDLQQPYRLAGILSPSLQLYVHPFSGKENFQFSFTGGRAASMPNNEEALINAGLESVLNPEQGWSIELQLGNATTRGNWQLSTYQIWVKDALVARPTEAGQQFFINGGSTIHRGLEGQFNYTFFQQQQWRGQVSAALSLGDYRFDEFINDDQDFSGNFLPGVPQWQWQGRCVLEYRTWYTQLIHEMQGRQALNDANTGFSDGFSLLHFRLGYRQQLPWNAANKQPIHYFIGVNNVLDTRYAAMVQVNARGFGGNLPRFFYPGLPRFVYVGIALDLRDLGN